MSAVRIEAVDVNVIFESPLFEKMARAYSDECRVKMLGSGEPNVNRGMYRTLQGVGMMQAFAAFREDDGQCEMCGFSALMKSPHLHLSIDLGHVETIYVSPRARSDVGLRLIGEMKRFARDEWNVPALVVSARVLSQFDEMMMAMVRRDRAVHTHNIYMLEL